MCKCCYTCQDVHNRRRPEFPVLNAVYNIINKVILLEEDETLFLKRNLARMSVKTGSWIMTARWEFFWGCRPKGGGGGARGRVNYGRNSYCSMKFGELV